MEKLNKVGKQRTFLLWLFIVTFVSFIIGMVFIALGKVEIFHIYSDFAEVMHYCLLKNPYDNSGGIRTHYPPLSFLLFYPFMLICVSQIKPILTDRGFVLENCHKMPLFLLSYYLYWAINLVIIFILLKKLTKLKGINLLLLFGITVFSGGFYMVFYRANVLITAFMLTLAFLYFYKSEKRWQRELAIVLFALAITIKIYVAVLGVLLIKDKKWKDILKLGSYTAIFVLVPYLFIKGNIINNIKLTVKNYKQLSSDMLENDIFVDLNIHGTMNITGMFVYTIDKMLTLLIGGHSLNITYRVLDVIKFAMLVCLVLACLAHRGGVQRTCTWKVRQLWC